MLTSILSKRNDVFMTAAEQVIGGKAETATFIKSRVLHSELRFARFRPRQFGRYQNFTKKGERCEVPEYFLPVFYC